MLGFVSREDAKEREGREGSEMADNGKEVLTYLRLTKRPLGVLLNFGGATFREGIRRIVNNPTDVASSRLRVNESSLIQVVDLGE